MQALKAFLVRFFPFLTLCLNLLLKLSTKENNCKKEKGTFLKSVLRERQSFMSQSDYLSLADNYRNLSIPKSNLNL